MKPQPAAAAPLNPNERLEPVVGTDQVQSFVPLGEEQYREGNVIWSSAAHEEARREVLGIGAREPEGVSDT